MTIYAAPGETIYPSVDWGTTGATLGVRIRRNTDNVDVVARTTSGVSESPASSGIYTKTTGLVVPTTGGAIYDVMWDDGSSYAIEDLVVTYSAAATGSPTGADLCTVADVKTAIGKTGTDDDTLIQTLVTAASTLIANTYQRDFAPVSSTTYRFEVIGYSVDLSPHDLRAATTVTLHPEASVPSTLTTSQYALKPVGAESNLGTYNQVKLANTLNLASTNAITFGYALLDITGTWGPATVPVDVARAAVVTVASWLDRLADQAALADFDITDGRSVSPDAFGSWGIPPSAHKILVQYARPAASFA